MKHFIIYEICIFAPGDEGACIPDFSMNLKRDDEGVIADFSCCDDEPLDVEQIEHFRDSIKEAFNFEDQGDMEVTFDPEWH